MIPKRSAEALTESVFSNPLDHIPLALEHMGLTEYGQYVFSAGSLDSNCDVLVLIQEPGGVALSLYCAPVDALDSEVIWRFSFAIKRLCKMKKVAYSLQAVFGAAAKMAIIQLMSDTQVPKMY